MAIEYKKKSVVLVGAVSVEAAEDLLQWHQNNPKGRVDLTACTHLHAAVLQVLMASQMVVIAWPQDEDLKTWLTTTLL
jgi:3-deoxy-D-manno-octulosonic-acid transferase